MRPARAALALLASLAIVFGSMAAAPAQTPDGDDAFDIDAERVEAFDAVADLVPDSSCVTVRVGASTLYSRNGSAPVVPASTLKILTAVVALDVLGPDHRFTTRVLGPEPVDGIVRGDLALVGGGDPMLATDAVVEHRDISDRNPTRLDRLADDLAASGIRRIEGGVIGDESRFDDLRTVPSWPERFVTQNQSGPLSALVVDDGYDWRLGETATRDRSPDPARSAAAHLTDLLEDRGIEVASPPRSGSAPAEGALAAIESAPLTAIVETLLLTSDNLIAELLVKELAVDAGAVGSTAAGLEVVHRRTADLGLDAPGSRIVDGSGLDPTNRVTCDQLVDVLEFAGGPDSRIGRGLPIAGRSGTLQRRFRDTPAEGRVRAKTGRLNMVSSLAGYSPLRSGETATFAFVVNDHDDDGRSQEIQELLVALLLDTDLPCERVEAPVVIPGSVSVAAMGSMSMFPLQTVIGPTMMAPLGLLADHPDTLLPACLAEDDDFEVLLTG